MFVIIFSKKKGVGKTSLLASFCLNEMHNRQRYLGACSEIDLLNVNRNIKLSKPPQDHVIFSNFKLHDDFGRFRYELDPYMVALPNMDIDYDIFPPHSFLACQELQIYFSSKEKINRYSTAFQENQRHAHIDFYGDTQRLMKINKDIREIADLFISPLSLEHKYNDSGKIIESIWHCVQFEDNNMAENYLSTGDLNLGQLVDYSYKGCIFDNYDSYDNKDLFYSTNKDFRYETNIDINKNLIAPDGYYL